MRNSTKAKILGQTDDPSDFHKAFSLLLQQKTEYLKNKGLTRGVCTQFYTTIFGCLANILENGGIQISNEAVNYIAQQYYDGILINNSQELDPNIFDKRANLENIPTKELILMAVMLKKTDFVWPIIETIKKRN